MNATFNRVSVIGLGYIGLPTAAMVASKEINVIGVDINPDVIHSVNAGKVHIVEPDLDVLVQHVVHMGHLQALNRPAPADVFLITVPTPFKENKVPDLSFVTYAAESIAPVLEKGNLVILESTSPVGTTEQLSRLLATLRPDLIFPHADAKTADISIAYCPERVMPGQILRELVENDRIIGVMTQHCAEKAKTFYQTFVVGACLLTDMRTAEMAKLTENAFRDVNIAFANELATICDKLKINVWELIQLANRHPRVNILQPGPGVGGHCIAVDPWFIVSAAPAESRLIRAAREVNDAKPAYVLNKIIAAAASLQNPVIACFGITYKPNTDDLRESPAIHIMQQLAITSAYRLLIVEPHIQSLPDALFNENRCQLVSAEYALSMADIIVMMVDHQVFRQLDDNLFNHKIMINVVSDRSFDQHTRDDVAHHVSAASCPA